MISLIQLFARWQQVYFQNAATSIIKMLQWCSIWQWEAHVNMCLAANMYSFITFQEVTTLAVIKYVFYHDDDDGCDYDYDHHSVWQLTVWRRRVVHKPHVRCQLPRSQSHDLATEPYHQSPAECAPDNNPITHIQRYTHKGFYQVARK